MRQTGLAKGLPSLRLTRYIPDRPPDAGDLFFPLGRGHVIKGWDEGLQGIKVRWTSLHCALGIGRMSENVRTYARMKMIR